MKEPEDEHVSRRATDATVLATDAALPRIVALSVMIATIHFADLGPIGAARAVLRRPRREEVRGLRSAEVTLLAPLALSGPPPLGRAGLIAFWDDEDSIDRFLDTHPTGRRFSGGFQARMRPLRASGSWPGLPIELPESRSVSQDGPIVVLTLSRVRMSQAVRFLRASRPAEPAAVAADGMIWATAAVRPPVMTTISIWESGRAAVAYAYGRKQPAHPRVIAEKERKDFNRQSAFIRFAPTRLEGALVHHNPLAASAVAI
ncbi:MAG: spheroidene monooxygenase [Actinomycetota bacterium]|nr:spheroidene monooxygenase [Actinomycetota bacterium]